MQLDDLLAGLSTEVEPFALCRVAGDSRLRFRGFEWTTLHFTLAGSGVIELGRARAMALRPFTLAVVPPQIPHSIVATGAAGRDDAVPLEVACGRVNVRYGDSIDLFSALSRPVAVDFAATPAMRRVFERLIEETASPRPGAAAATSALMRECLVLLLRELCPDPDCTLPWLAALSDQRLGPVVTWVAADPGQPISVDGLAVRAGMSRTAFAQAFNSAFGQPPMAYVRAVRMDHAAELLRTSDLPLEVVASRVGYRSRSHFTRAFTGHHGRSPGAFRQARHR